MQGKNLFQRDLSVAPGPAYGMPGCGAGAVHRLVEGEGELTGGPRSQGQALPTTQYSPTLESKKDY